jgi:hypothetical protein
LEERGFGLKLQGHEIYGETYNVFYPHQREFLNVVNVLQWHLRDQLDIVMWFDLFSINQHKTNDFTFDWLMNTLCHLYNNLIILSWY